jgi:hemerythrin
MSRFEWKDDYSVGHPGIDADHQGLFQLIRELEEADMTDGLLGQILARLEDYAKVHFTREEGLMKRGGFPDFDAHVKQHRIFEEWLKTVKTTYRRASESPFQVGDLVNAFLENWLVKHIMEEDMAYREFVAKVRD